MLFPSFKKYLHQHDLIRSGDLIFVALSGGVDSMTLLHLLKRVAKEKGTTLVAAHVNHLLRGRASDADERLVRKSCESLGIECHVLRKRPAKGKNLQDAARRIRYGFLEQIVHSCKTRVLATAHHANDQAETILMHLIRGSGLPGLSGMRPSVMRGGLRLIRPLLFSRKSEIEEYARKEKISFRSDASNTSEKYRRNEVRHRLVPLLEGMNPRIVEGLCALGERLLQADEALEFFSRSAMEKIVTVGEGETVSMDRDSFNAMPEAIRSRIVHIAFETLSGSRANLNADQIAKVIALALGENGRSSYRLPSAVKFNRKRDQLILSKSWAKCDR